jgi:hypothetical protein
MAATWSPTSSCDSTATPADVRGQNDVWDSSPARRTPRRPRTRVRPTPHHRVVHRGARFDRRAFDSCEDAHAEKSADLTDSPADPPNPTTPSILPASSLPPSWRFGHFPFRTCASASQIRLESAHDQADRGLGHRLRGRPGTRATLKPWSLQYCTSMLSKPDPRRVASSSFGAISITDAEMATPLRRMMASRSSSNRGRHRRGRIRQRHRAHCGASERPVRRCDLRGRSSYCLDGDWGTRRACVERHVGPSDNGLARRPGTGGP